MTGEETATRTKICKRCGEKFIVNKSSKRTVCDNCTFHRKGSEIPEFKICSDCGLKFKPVFVNQAFCPKCKEKRMKKRAETMKKNMKEKYGGTSSFNSPSLQEKRRKTMIEKYGGEYTFSCPNLLAKARKTMVDRYGTDNSWKSPEIREKFQQTMAERYGCIKGPLSSPELLEKARRTLIERYGVSCTWRIPDLVLKRVNNSQMLISSFNRKFSEKLTEKGIENSFEFVIFYDNSKKYMSYDIKVDKRLIEIDPTITHNSKFSPFGRPVDNGYHYRKTILAVSNGFRCIHIFDWDDKEKIVHLLRKDQKLLYARKLEVKEVSSKSCNLFEEQYHLQGKCRGQVVRVGLYKDDELIQLMTFGKPRYNKKYEWELLRLCTSFDYKVVGGAERLFKQFLKKYQPTSIISYCDLSKFTGEVYKRLGMVEAYVTSPQKVWSKGSQKITDNYLRQHGADRLIGTSDGKGTDNEEIMIREGWLPVYDCGQIVFEWLKNSN